MKPITKGKFEFYIGAMTKSNVFAYQKFIVFNTAAPLFAEDLTLEHTVDVRIDALGVQEDSTDYIYKSPIVNETDPIAMSFTGTEALSFVSFL